MTDVMDKPTTSPISTRKHGDVLIVESNNPPVNALSAPLRQGLVAAIEKAEADDDVNAVVIACEGQTFFAGADITEFGKPPVMPWLPQVVDRIEACTKPVVAAIHGTALGGGLEVALGCHYRVAVPTAKLGTPEVKLGLLPGAGGTQRLPRVAGVEKALQMCATGNPIGAKEAFDCGLVDRLVEGDLLPHAVAYAEEVKRHPPASQIVRAPGPGRERRRVGVRRIPQGECPQVPRLRGSGSQYPRGEGRDRKAL
jgi:3-hydroxyacyl-CoA dehydrogenase